MRSVCARVSVVLYSLTHCVARCPLPQRQRLEGSEAEGVWAGTEDHVALQEKQAARQSQWQHDDTAQREWAQGTGGEGHGDENLVHIQQHHQGQDQGGGRIRDAEHWEPQQLPPSQRRHGIGAAAAPWGNAANEDYGQSASHENDEGGWKH